MPLKVTRFVLNLVTQTIKTRNLFHSILTVIMQQLKATTITAR